MSKEHMPEAESVAFPRPPLRIAHVGSYDSSVDHAQADSVYRWLFTHLPAFVEEMDTVHDIINLDFSRDFLTESKKYDLVILHNICNSVHHQGKARPGTFNVSPLHNASAWRRRLASTGAHVIGCVGNEDEVAGRYLMDIPGYERHQMRDLTVYVRIA